MLTVAEVRGGSAPVYMPAIGYTAYERGDGTRPYSARYIAELSVRDAMENSMPMVLPRGALTFINWSPTIPDSDTLEGLDPRTCIPHYDDIRTVLAEQPHQYMHGKRSVVVRAHGKFFSLLKRL
jgi:hypothetical protein